MIHRGALITLVLTLAAPAAAQQSLPGALDQLKQLDGAKNVAVDIVENGRRGKYNCGGGNARIAGNKNIVTLTDCSTVVVSGNQNGITARAARVLRLLGNNNSIKWSSKTRPTVDNAGSSNSIARL